MEVLREMLTIGFKQCGPKCWVAKYQFVQKMMVAAMRLLRWICIYVRNYMCICVHFRKGEGSTK